MTEHAGTNGGRDRPPTPGRDRRCRPGRHLCRRRPHEVRPRRSVSIDLFERMPAPFGLIRYGVAPDHPRIKGIITALHKVLDKPQVRLLGNIDYGTDINLDDLRRSTTRSSSPPAPTPTARSASRVSTSTAATAPPTSSPGTTATPTCRAPGRSKPRRSPSSASATSRSTSPASSPRPATNCCPPRSRRTSTRASRTTRPLEVHVFGRRGPAQAKFTPLELRELDHSPNIEVIVDPEDIDYDEGSEQARRNSKQVDMVCEHPAGLGHPRRRRPPAQAVPALLRIPQPRSSARTARSWACAPSAPSSTAPATSRAPARTRTGTSRPSTAPSATSRRTSPQLPFDDQAGTVPNEAGRVLADDTAEDAARFLPRPTSPAGSSAAPSASSATPRATPTKPSRTCSRMPPPSPAPPSPIQNAVIEFLEGKRLPFTTWARLVPPRRARTLPR